MTTPSSPAKSIWITGATGRCGAGIAQRLIDLGSPIMLVGRQMATLLATEQQLENPNKLHVELVEASNINQVASLLATAKTRPAVLVNTVGAFVDTGPVLIPACIQHKVSYVDVSNEFESTRYALGEEMHSAALSAGVTICAGAGWGFQSTESLVRKMCAEHSHTKAVKVRVDAIPTMASAKPILKHGVMGEALVSTILASLVEGGKEVKGGKVVAAGQGLYAQTLTLPDKSTQVTSSVSTGDSIAAWRASGAPDVVFGSPFLPPANMLTRIAIPAAQQLLKWQWLRSSLTARLARIKMKEKPDKKRREWSYAHCAIEFADGSKAESWLQAPEGLTFTNDAAALSAFKLTTGAYSGAKTPCELFGYDFVTEFGAKFL